VSASHKTRFSPRPAVAVETTTEAVAPAVTVTLTPLAPEAPEVIVETPTGAAAAAAAAPGAESVTPAPAESAEATPAETPTSAPEAGEDDGSTATVSTDAAGVVSSTFNIRTTPVLTLTVVRKFQPNFGAGVLSDLHRSMLNKFVEEQFQTWATNRAKSRAKKLLKAQSEAERHENRVYAVADYLRQWSEFEPHVAERGPRQDPKQKMLEETALEYWDNRIAAHNDRVARGEPGLIPARLGQSIPPRILSKGEFARARGFGRMEGTQWVTSQEATQPYKSYLADVEKQTPPFVAQLLASAKHRPAIDALVAAKLAPKPSASASPSLGAALSADEID